MPLAAGSRLGPYEIQSALGAGGMGEVYKARDTRLDRTVAIKILPATLAADPQFRDRFDREARSISQLDHPHICALYDVGQQNGTAYLVMQYLEGETLADRLTKGALPLDQALQVAIQIADALAAAHAAGIVHRDLKPGNVMLTKGGIKLLDFGLAKAGARAIAGADLSAVPTTPPITQQGSILGTLQYMAPEQIEGHEADARTDLFAFGAVVYEMLTGKKAFEGKSQASLIGAIMHTEPPAVSTLQPIAPRALDRVVKKCLAKEATDRWQTARDLCDELQWLAEPEAGARDARATIPTAARPSVGWRGALPWVVAVGALAAAAIVLTLWAPWRAFKPVDRPLVRLDVDLGAEVSLPAPGLAGTSIAISPDGTRLVYASGTPVKLFTRRLDQPKATELPGTQDATAPFFSPDGQWVGFMAAGKLNKISVDGGAVVPLGDIKNFVGASWGEDGSILVSEAFGKGLLRMPADGGPPEAVAPGSMEVLADPQILPGGKAILFKAATAAGVDNTTIEVLTLVDHHRKILVRGGASPRYLPTSGGAGHLVYVNKATLFAIPFDLNTLEARGPAVPVLDDVAYQDQTGTGEFDVSRTGTLVYRRASGAASAMTTVQWVDPFGRKAPLQAKPGVYRDLRLSPDGKRVALPVIDGGSIDLWVYDPQRDAMTRLTFGGLNVFPRWSPDGRYVVFFSSPKGIFQARANGASQPHPLTQSRTTQIPWSFTPDGKRLAYLEGEGSLQIWTVPLEDQGDQLHAGKPEPFLKSSFSEFVPEFSPDGRWLAYQSNESGKVEVYVRAFPPPSSGQGGQWQISNSGGMEPHWSRNGHELMYRSGDQIMAARYTVNGGALVAEKPRVWIAKLGGTLWDLAPDGQRVAVLTPVESAEGPKREHEVVFLQNFFDELRRRVPTR